jgi:hypothetical protein
LNAGAKHSSFIRELPKAELHPASGRLDRAARTLLELR